MLKQAVWQSPQGTAMRCSFRVLPSCSSLAKSESRSLRVLLSIWSLNSASVLHRPASFPGTRPRFGVQEVGPSCKYRAELSLPIPSSTNKAAAAHQGGANRIFTAQKAALGFELNFLRFFFFFPPTLSPAQVFRQLGAAPQVSQRGSPGLHWKSQKGSNTNREVP